MKPFPKIHDWYIARTVLLFVLAAWLVVVGLDFIYAVQAEMGNVKGNFSSADALVTALYTLPYRFYFHFPTAAVIGSLLALGQLAASSELTVMRALGLSRLRISLSVAAVIALITALMMLNAETLSPWAQNRSVAYKTSKKFNDQLMLEFRGVWAREGDTFISAVTGAKHQDASGSWMELGTMRMYEFEPDGRLKSIAYAERGEHRQGSWVLRNVERMSFGTNAVTRTRVPEEKWASTLDETALASTVERPRFMSTARLREALAYRHRNQLDPGEIEEHYWGHWFYPINVLALCLAAIPFAFGTLRSGGLGKRLFLGIVFAIGFAMLQLQATRLAGVYHFDYRLAYLVPVLVMLAMSAMLFRRRSQ